jgi:hypothetical protein
VSIETSPTQFERLAGSEDRGPVIMLNLLRFKERVDGTDPAYLEIHAHRAAALADSRLIACNRLPD